MANEKGGYSILSNKKSGAMLTAAGAFSYGNTGQKAAAAAQMVQSFSPGFANSSIGRGFINGANAVGLSSSIGNTFGNPTIGAAAGAAAGAVVAGPIGALVGGIFGWIGGRSARSEREKQKKELGREISYQTSLAELALAGAKRTKDENARQLKNIIDMAAIKKDTILLNEEEAKRVASQTIVAVQEATETLLGEQKVELSTSGFGRRGGDWFVLGSTEGMGEKRKQEARHELEVQLNAFAIQKGDVDREVEEATRAADYANFKVDLDIKSVRKQTERNIRTLSQTSASRIRTQRIARAKAIMKIGSALISESNEDKKSSRADMLSGALG